MKALRLILSTALVCMAVAALSPSVASSASWSPWSSLDGELTSGPGAGYVRFPQKIATAVRGTDGMLWYRVWTSSGWSGWLYGGAPGPGSMAVPQPFKGQPAIAGIDPEGLTVYVRGYDDRLWAKSIGENGSSAPWLPWGGVLTSSPAVSTHFDETVANHKVHHIFVRGTDNQLWYRMIPVNHSWPTFPYTQWTPLGGVLTSAPAAASWQPGRIDVFARSTNNTLSHRVFIEGSGWFQWEDLGGELTSGPTVASWGPNRLDVFARGTDAALWHKFWANGWSNWSSLGGGIAPDAAPAATSVGTTWGVGHLDVYIRGTDNRLWHRYWQ